MEEGIELRAAQLTSRKQLRAFLGMEMDKDLKLLVSGLVETLVGLMDRVYEIEKRLRDVTADDEDVALLQTIPGTGLVCASAVRAIVADIRRFNDPKKLAAYAGLVPWVKNSNEKTHHGHITKYGSTILRNALVQMAMGLIRSHKKLGNRSPSIYYWYEQLARRAGGSKGKIGLARKLATVVWAMLYNREKFVCAA